jgi:roadblock/LC7 domain-containing protein
MGVTRGIGNNLFGYGQQITRQDMAVMIYKVLAANGGLEGIEADGFTFTDDASIADYAREAVYAMRAKGIINGNPDGTFCPNDSATRAQAAKMLCAAMGI